MKQSSTRLRGTTPVGGTTHVGDVTPAPHDPEAVDETFVGEEPPVEPSTHTHAPGSTVGRYVVLQQVGAGGMGAVFAAYDPQLNRKIALKILHPTTSSKMSGSRPGASARTRLLREAQAIARLSHPNVVRVYDVGTLGDAVFVAMEFIEGTTLTRWLEREPPLDEVLDVFGQAGRGLAAAHHANLVHRDFKPDNVLVGEGHPRQVCVSDFGLARSDPSAVREADDSDEDLEPSRSLTDSDVLSSPLTQAGAVVGTPRYMAPEQHCGQTTDARSDQFSFCVALYQALYGQDPFAAPTLERLALAKQDGEVRPIPNDSTVPPHLEAVVMRGLSPEPERRFATMDDLVDAMLDNPGRRRRRKVRRGALGLLIIGAAAMLGYAQAGRDDGVCGGARNRLSGVWDDARRSQVREAIGAPQVSYAARTADRVESMLDDYADDWVELHVEACEATHVRHEQSDLLLDRRMMCLAHRKSAMEALVDVLAEADLAVVQRAVQAVASLPPLEACSNAEFLLAQVELPADERTNVAVAKVREQLAHATALRQAGKYQDALQVARTARESAERIEYRPLRAEALMELGDCLETTGDYVDAEKILAEAVWEATRARHDEYAAMAATELVGVVGDRLARHKEGLRWEAHARAILDRLGLEGAHRAELDVTVGNVLYRMGRPEDARVYYERAAGLRERMVGSDDPVLAAQLVNLGNVQYSQGDYDEALQTFARAHDIVAESLGEDHPVAATALASEGLVHLDLDQPLQAERRFAGALVVFRSAMGPEHPFVAGTLANLGLAIQAQGRRTAAKERFEASLAIYAKTVGTEHPDYARALHNLGRLHMELDEHDEALRQIERAQQIRRRTLPAEHADHGASLAALAELDLRQGNAARAVLRYDEALAHYEASQTTATTRAEARFGLARALALSGEHERSRATAERARAELEAVGASRRSLASDIDAWLSRATPKQAP